MTQERTAAGWKIALLGLVPVLASTGPVSAGADLVGSGDGSEA